MSLDNAWWSAALVYGVVLMAMSFVSAGLLWWDKRAARRDRRRVPEKTLHLVELLGGWPGSWGVRRAIRHKTRKRSYRLAFASIVLLHAGAVIVAVLWRF